MKNEEKGIGTPFEKMRARARAAPSERGASADGPRLRTKRESSEKELQRAGSCRSRTELPAGHRHGQLVAPRGSQRGGPLRVRRPAHNERSFDVGLTILRSASFPTRIYLQKSVSIQPRTSPLEVWGKSIQYYSFVSLRAPEPERTAARTRRAGAG